MKTVVFRGPGKNSLSTALMEATLATVKEAGDAPLFLVGDGDAFSAGLNLKEVASLDVAGMGRFLGALEALVRALYEHPAPVVAFVNGHAIAGGCVMALCADMRIMTGRQGPKIGLNEVALGLKFPPLTWAMVRARVPDSTLERVILEAGLYDAPLAKELGLIDAIGEESDARAIFERMATYPKDAYAAAKAILRKRLTVEPALQKEFVETIVPSWVAPALKERLLAQLKK